jgi:hypothetical protein
MVEDVQNTGVFNAFAALSDMMKQNFEMFSEMRQMEIVLSGTRGYVLDFRYLVYWDVKDRDPHVHERFPTLGSFQSAMKDEKYRRKKTSVISSTGPMTSKFDEAVARLGISLSDWHMLCTCNEVFGYGNTYSETEANNRFTLEELKAVPFPNALEKCRPVLTQIAIKVLEHESARTQSSDPNAGSVDDLEFLW